MTDADQNIMPPTVNETGAGSLLLRMAVSLLQSGSSTDRIINNINRMAGAFGLTAHLDVTLRAVSLSLVKEKHIVFNGTRTVGITPGVNFQTLSEISRLSWAAREESWSLPALEKEMDRITRMPVYHRLLVLVAVGLAGSSFCFTFGGSAREMILTFLATVVGLFVKQEMSGRDFNPYLTTYLSATVAAGVIGVGSAFGRGSSFEIAFATCSLFLIPGVPLINSCLDLIHGHNLNGIDRAISSLVQAFAIAAGLATILFLFNYTLT